MIKKILLGMTLLMSMVSCTEDFTDWAHPQTNPQEKAVAFGDGSVTPVGVINLADVNTETVKVELAYSGVFNVNSVGCISVGLESLSSEHDANKLMMPKSRAPIIYLFFILRLLL
jgi:hypothetical protein